MTQAKRKPKPRSAQDKKDGVQTMRLLVTIDDGEYTVNVKLGDLVAFERQFGCSFAEVNVERPRIEYVLFLGWHACKRLGITADEFDSWLDRVEGVEEAAGAPLADSKETS